MSFKNHSKEATFQEKEILFTLLFPGVMLSFINHDETILLVSNVKLLLGLSIMFLGHSEWYLEKKKKKTPFLISFFLLLSFTSSIH